MSNDIIVDKGSLNQFTRLPFLCADLAGQYCEGIETMLLKSSMLACFAMSTTELPNSPYSHHPPKTIPSHKKAET